MTAPDIEWPEALQEMHDSLPKRLEDLARVAERANYWTDVERLMPATGVADLIYEALDEIERYREISKGNK